MKELLEKIEQLQEDIDKRNIATKVWIQSDTQVRAYANKLEKRIDSLFAEIRHGDEEHQLWLKDKIKTHFKE